MVTIIVTGSEGFLGRHLVKKLLNNKEYDVIGLDIKTKWDLRDLNQIKEALNYYNPDIIIHLAAIVGGIQANKKYPGKFFYDNLIMGIQLMEQARIKGIEKFVAIGTICAYPKYTKVPFREEDLWNGYPEETNAAYGLAKKMLLVQAQAYRQQYGFNAIYLMPVNLYGQGDNFDPEYSHVIPALIKKCFDAKDKKQPEIIVWGTGKATREFLYVEDCAEGIIKATELYNKSDPVNLGTGQMVSIKDLIELIVKLTGYKGKIVFNSSMPDGQPLRCVNTVKAFKEFGFMTKTSLKDGLKKTIDWYVQTR